MNSDTFNFLEALTSAAGEDSPILDASPGDFSPAMVAAVGSFCRGFREYVNFLGIDPDTSKRSFGGNVYFSLSGHGCGFWGDSAPWGEVLQAALENFSGSRHRFEELADNLDWDGENQGEGEICAGVFLSNYGATWLEKTFAVPDVATLPALSDCVAIAYCPEKEDLRTVPATGFSPPPYWQGCAWTLEPWTLARFEELTAAVA